MSCVSRGRLICSLLVIWSAACGDPLASSDASVDSGPDEAEAGSPDTSDEDAGADDADASEEPAVDASEEEPDSALDASEPALDAATDASSLDATAQSDAALDAGSDAGPADQDQDGVLDGVDQCPNFDNRTCAHGDCSSGSCVCSAGWAGAQCDSCAANHYGASCTACACGSHGTCSAGLSGTGACSCATGFAGSACNGCAAGRFGSNCDVCTCTNGTCADGLTGSGLCSTCNAGYYGQNCSQACPNCGTHGTCNGGPSGNGQCTCAAGFAGTLCNIDLTGTGNDGNVTFSADTNLSSVNTGTRSCSDGGDMVSYSVSSLQNGTASSATLTDTPGAGCLNVGDEVLLINLQGTAAANANVGQYEFLRVQSVQTDTVTFSTLKTRFYGSGASDDLGLGTSASSQRVLLQRVPNYNNVTVNASVSLTARRWDGSVGGVFYLRAHGTLTVEGAITMNGQGYRGGAATMAAGSAGNQGETYTGFGSAVAYTPNRGGGGGGQGDSCAGYGTSAGGGGHRLDGNNGTASCAGEGGLAYGAANLARATLGSGGGSGGNDDVISDDPPGARGGFGGGFVGVSVNTLVGGGLIEADGTEGDGDTGGVCSATSTTSCWDESGAGGGGAGGSVYVYRLVNNFGGGIYANGGDGGDGADLTAGEGGNGALGYVVLAP